MFPFKDKPNLKAQSLVVYHIKCLDCEADYIGKTSCILNKRVEQHQLKSSSIGEHIQKTGHSIDHDNIVILDRASNDQKLVWKEMLYIRKLKPTLNIQLNAELHTYIIPKARGINDKISDIENYVKKFVPHKNITN
jgi:hypothetical protein